jgi:hypothetical protein
MYLISVARNIIGINPAGARTPLAVVAALFKDIAL